MKKRVAEFASEAALCARFIAAVAAPDDRLTRQRPGLPRVRASLAHPRRSGAGRDCLSFFHLLPQQPDLRVRDHRDSRSLGKDPSLWAVASHAPSGRRPTCKSSCRHPAEVVVAHHSSPRSTRPGRKLSLENAGTSLSNLTPNPLSLKGEGARRRLTLRLFCCNMHH